MLWPDTGQLGRWKDSHVSLEISLFLLAVGATLAFAVNYSASGVDLAAVGWIPMGVGALGVLLYLLFLAGFAPFSRGSTTEIVERPVSRLYQGGRSRPHLAA